MVKLFSTPVLILGFRRPANIVDIIEAMRTQRPTKIFFAVDGPRQGKVDEQNLVRQTQLAIKTIDWECDVKVRFRGENLGIRKAVPDAVSWVLESNSEVIVIEDDAIPGPELLEFMKNQLEKYRENEGVAHVSGYNLVPEEKLSRSNELIRRSIYPESYLWGTWAKSWSMYDDNIDDYISIVQKMNLSRLEKVVWRINFRMANKDLIQTWAYRWVASMWRENKVCISPNVNLTTYIGSQDGTHTRRKSRVIELEVSSGTNKIENDHQEIDVAADVWIAQNIFHAKPKGIALQVLAFSALWVLDKFSQ